MRVLSIESMLDTVSVFSNHTDIQTMASIKGTNQEAELHDLFATQLANIVANRIGNVVEEKLKPLEEFLKILTPR